MNDQTNPSELINRYLDGIATLGETQTLEGLIIKDAAVRLEFLRFAHLDAGLAGSQIDKMQDAPDCGEAKSQAENQVPVVRTKRIQGRFRWLKPPLTSATFGLIIGLFSASIVWAYVAPIGSEVTVVMIEGFESASMEIARKVPLANDLWRAVHAEVVQEEVGVKPASGHQMLRFVRAGFIGRTVREGDHITDVYRVINVRTVQHQITGDDLVAQVSASMNACPFSADEAYGCSVSIYALAEDGLPESADRVGMALTANATAMARSTRTNLDADPSQWQRLTAELQLPSNTAFLVVRLHISQAFDAKGKSRFTGSYVDDVTVSLKCRVPLL